MTQKESLLKLLEDGPLSVVQMVDRLAIKRSVVVSVLKRMKKTREVAALAKTYPRLYELHEEPYEDLFNAKPSITKCSYCKKAINKKTRKVEPRESGPRGEVQQWAFCIPCFEAQKESRKIPTDLTLHTPHISTLAMSASPFRLRRKV